MEIFDKFIKNFERYAVVYLLITGIIIIFKEIIL